MIALAYALSGITLLMSLLFLIQMKNPLGWVMLVFKLAPGALSPYWAIMGLAGAIFGWAQQAFWAVPMGLVGAGMMAWYVRQVTRDHDGFEKAFGPNWSDKIRPQQARSMLPRRWSMYVKMKAAPEPIWERDKAFWTIPGTERELLCDIWRPAGGQVSGLAFIYLHGSGWALFDKDMGTRPFFRHLVSQGHVVMDVAYRLLPEVDIYGMVGDVKRAIAWMKANAFHYGVNPEKIVLGGGSAGGQIALLAAYSPRLPELTPEDLEGGDLSVHGVISCYGPTDLLAAYHHMNLKQIEGLPRPPAGQTVTTTQRIQYGARFDILLGGWPQDVPHMYQLASPSAHVAADSPATLLIQGQQDFITAVDATCTLYEKLVEAGVPAINIVFPWTDHGFDLAVPQINPAAQSALYDVDRFLAFLVSKEWPNTTPRRLRRIQQPA